MPGVAYRLLDAPVRSRVARRRAEAKLVCGAGCFADDMLCNGDHGDAALLARGMALLRLTPLDGHGLRQALKQAKAA